MSIQSKKMNNKPLCTSTGTSTSICRYRKPTYETVMIRFHAIKSLVATSATSASTTAGTATATTVATIQRTSRRCTLDRKTVPVVAYSDVFGGRHRSESYRCSFCRHYSGCFDSSLVRQQKQNQQNSYVSQYRVDTKSNRQVQVQLQLQQQQQQQRRLLAINTNSGKRGRDKEAGWFVPREKRPQLQSKDVLRTGNIAYNNKVSNVVKLHICHNEYDAFVVQADQVQDRLFLTLAKFSVNDVLEKIKLVYPEFKEKYHILEYYDTNDVTWRPILHINDVLSYRGGTIALKVRVPQYYDETPLPPDYLSEHDETLQVRRMQQQQDSRIVNDYNSSLISTTIQALVILIKYDGYTRSDIKHHVLVRTRGDGSELSTRQYILHRAAHDDTLRSVILNHTHVLDHMIELIHYDFVWKKV
jgi:hypothetical protein